jgi:hypothetical protein
LIKKGRVAAGTIEIAFELKNNIVRGINILGDYFVLGDVEAAIERLKGVELDATSIRKSPRKRRVKRLHSPIYDRGFPRNHLSKPQQCDIILR